MLYKLDNNNKNICKDIFVDRYEQVDIVKDYKYFLTKIEELKPYMIEFDKFSIIKPKVYYSS